MRKLSTTLLWQAVRHWLGAVLLVLAVPAFAGEAEDKVALDRLFLQLRNAPDAASAEAIDQQIWDLWMTPADPVLKKRMDEVLLLRSMGDIAGAVTLLDTLVIDYPGYAEGWNQRATMYYVMGDFDRSIADCARVLALEPRHFGALSGRALMYLQLGQRELALRDMTSAVAIHPYLNERQLFPELGVPATRI
jgi:tetratricopeptide (TPR) repeat protein